MIDYSPFWETIKLKQISTYTLIHTHKIPSATIQRLRHNEPISTKTLDDLCQLLECHSSDIMEIYPDNYEQNTGEKISPEEVWSQTEKATQMKHLLKYIEKLTGKNFTLEQIQKNFDELLTTTSESEENK